MPNISPSWTMIGLDILMIIYTLWVLSAFKPMGRIRIGIGAALAAWLRCFTLDCRVAGSSPRTFQGPPSSP